MNGTALSSCMTQIEVSCDLAFLSFYFKFLLQELYILESHFNETLK